MSDTLPSILDRLAGLRAYLGAAETMLKDGAMPDMQGLDHRIAGLCQDIEQVEGKSRETCLAELKAVLESLDICRAGLMTWKQNHD